MPVSVATSRRPPHLLRILSDRDRDRLLSLEHFAFPRTMFARIRAARSALKECSTRLALFQAQKIASLCVVLGTTTQATRKISSVSRVTRIARFAVVLGQISVCCAKVRKF